MFFIVAVSGPSSASTKTLSVYHNGYRVPACTLGIGPAPCQRIVSPVDLTFATPTAVGSPGQGGYDVMLSGDTITVVAYVDQTPIGPCPSTDGAACLTDAHNLQDDAGLWNIRY